MAAIEGGFVAVVAKNAFAGTLSPGLLNLGVGIAAAAPAVANLTSFYWSDFGTGRRKNRTVAILLVMAAIALSLVALLPTSPWGFAAFIIAVLASRSFWTGAITLRSAVWRANFPRTERTVFTGQVSLLNALGMATASFCAGIALDASSDLYRLIYPLAGLSLGTAGIMYRRMRVRGQKQLLAEEVRERQTHKRGIRGAFELLQTDRPYRRYMVRMFYFGSGNLMVVSISVLLMADVLDLSRLQQMLVTSTIPMLVFPLTMPLWSDFFNTANIARFRSVQGIFFVSSMLCTLLAVWLDYWPLLWVGAALAGTGYTGGNIGWHLGHNAFASDGRATDYMAVHVSLTGLRGVIAPVCGVLLYQWLAQIDPSLALHAMWLPITLSIIGTLGFVQLDRELGRQSQSGNGS